MTTPTQDEIRQMVARLRGAEYIGHDVGMSGVCFELKDEGLIEDAAVLLSRLAQQKPSAWALDFGQGINTMTTFATEKEAICYAAGCAPSTIVALYAAPVPVAQQEPVAWRFPYDDTDDGWYIVDSVTCPGPADDAAVAAAWQPLYAAPVPAPNGEEGK